MRKFPVVYMRGGTSKGIMFLEKDLPGREEWDDIFVQCMGSPDPKQIDGVGGCVSSNNKIVVVRPSERPGVDVDYIVGQSIVGQSKIDYKSNCGNMTAATAPYAVEMGLVEHLTDLSDRTFASSDELLDCVVTAQSTHVCKMFLTEKRHLCQSYVYSEGTVFTLAGRDGRTQTGYEGISCLGGSELFIILAGHLRLLSLHR